MRAVIRGHAGFTRTATDDVCEVESEMAGQAELEEEEGEREGGSNVKRDSPRQRQTARTYFTDTLSGRYCATNWYHGNYGFESGPHFAASSAPALLGFDDEIAEYCIAELPANATFLTHQQRLECYAQRYSDLLLGYCNGKLKECDWKALEWHWQNHGRFEKREFGCPHVQYCTQANFNLLNLVDEDKVPYNMCRNLEWQMCAAQGHLPGQGGIIGGWAASIAAERGASVLLADKDPTAHSNGSSHGDGRIWRFAYAEEEYVDMMAHSLPLWHRLQHVASPSSPLLASTGGLTIFTPPSPEHSGLLSLCDRRGIAYEALSASQVSRRFPQLQLLPGQQAIFQEQSGALFASRCVSACHDYVRALGGDADTRFRLCGLRNEEGIYTLLGADGREHRASSVILAPGAWISELSQTLFGLHLPTRVSAEVVSYFAPEKGTQLDHSFRAMPVFLCDEDNGLGRFGYYGMPVID
ncbi:MAG: hypothetical protein SGPRY_010266, partial [Prymnesium sp.]